MGVLFNRGGGSAPVVEARGSDFWADSVFRRNVAYKDAGRVTADKALTHSAVYGCVDLLADLVSTFPVHRYKDISKGGKEQVKGKDSVIEKPSDVHDDVNWRRIMVCSWLLRGFAAGIVTRKKILNRRPTPEKIELIHPDRVSFQRDRPDAPVRYYLDGKETKLWPRGLLWIGNGKMMNPEDPVGRSILEFAAADINLGLSARKFGADWFDGGGHPTAVLKNEKGINKMLPEGLSAEDGAARIRERFLAALRTGEPVILSDGWDYDAIQIKPDESQFLSTIGANEIMVCSFFRVPPSLLGYASSEGGMITYQNMEDKGLDLLKFTIQPWVTRMEMVLNSLVPDNQYTKLNIDSLLRTDTKRRYEAYALAVKTGWTNNNWVRDKEDLPPEDGLDQFLWPPNRANMSLEEMAGDPDEGVNEPINPPTITAPKPNQAIKGAKPEEGEEEEEEQVEEEETKPPAKKKGKK